VFDDATGVGVVSITDHAQESLGDVVFVELPTIGSKVGKGGECTVFFGSLCHGRTVSSMVVLRLAGGKKWRSCEGLMRSMC
jgi:Glycine cleavage H-protein